MKDRIAAMENKIDYYRKLRGLSVQELADKTGMSRVHLSNIKSGKKNLNTRHLQSLSDILDVTPSELLFHDKPEEDGHKITDFNQASSRPYQQAMPRNPRLKPSNNRDPFADFFELPVYDSAPQTADTLWERQNASIIDTVIVDTHSLYKQCGENPDDFFYMIASGDAMDPDIVSGDYILVDTSQTKPHEGYVFVINSPEGLLLKRLQVHGEKIVLTSSNPRISTREESLESLDIIGRAIQRITKENL